MKILPQTKAAKIRFGVILALLITVLSVIRVDRLAGYYISDKKTGDILFQSLPHAELVDAIEGVTNSAWSHCGILVLRDGRWFVAEAIGEVRYTPLCLWIVRGRGSRVDSYRVKNFKDENKDQITAGVEKLLGRSYDFSYAPDDSEIYCSELVYKVYDRQLGIKVGDWEKLGDLNWKPMERFISSNPEGLAEFC
jgi:hypothetical protein